MSKQNLVEANEKRHVLALIRKYGLAGARRMLGDKPPAMQTLRKRAIAAGIPIPSRGRPAVYKKQDFVKLLAKFKSFTKVRKSLVEKGLPCPTNPMLGKWADEAGIDITRGRPVMEAAA